MRPGDDEDRERENQCIIYRDNLQSLEWPSIRLEAYEDGHQSSHQRHAACVENSWTIGANTTVLSTGRSKYVPGNGGSLIRKLSA